MLAYPLPGKIENANLIGMMKYYAYACKGDAYGQDLLA